MPGRHNTRSRAKRLRIQQDIAVYPQFHRVINRSCPSEPVQVPLELLEQTVQEHQVLRGEAHGEAAEKVGLGLAQGQDLGSCRRGQPEELEAAVERWAELAERA